MVAHTTGEFVVVIEVNVLVVVVVAVILAAWAELARYVRTAGRTEMLLIVMIFRR
jgi:hypothetical protein